MFCRYDNNIILLWVKIKTSDRSLIMGTFHIGSSEIHIDNNKIKVMVLKGIANLINDYVELI